MKLSKSFAHAALATVIGAGITAMTSQAIAAKKMVKCYGVAKAKQNDCGTTKHACAGQATKNYDPKEWKFVPAGTCKALRKKLAKLKKEEK